MNMKKVFCLGLALSWAVIAWGYSFNNVRVELQDNITSATLSCSIGGGKTPFSPTYTASQDLEAIDFGSVPITVTQIVTANDNGYDAYWRAVVYTYTTQAYVTTGPYAVGGQFTAAESTSARTLTLQAYAVPKVFSISYQTNGGTIQDVSYATKYTFSVGVSALPSISRPGYTFEGWYANAGFTGGRVYSVGTSTYGDLVFYAKWSPKSYTIAATASPSAAGTIVGAGDYLYDSTATLTAVPNVGWSFDRWNDGISSSNRQFTVTQSATYTAIFKANVYSITYRTNGGQITDDPYATHYTYGIGTNLPTQVVFSQNACSFEGWYENAQFTGNKATTIAATAYGDKTFYAKWSTNDYAITTRCSPATGGTITGAGSYPYLTRITLSAQPNTGWVFVKWTDDVLAPAVRQVTVTQPVHYTAEFEQEAYTVTFDKQGGWSGDTGVTAHYDEIPANITVPMREGYDFDGYYTQPCGKGTKYYTKDGTPSGVVWSTTAGGTLYAQWIPHAYQVVFEGNGATAGEMAAMNLHYGEETNLTALAFSKEGYVFTGWLATNLAELVVFEDGALISNLTAEAEATVSLKATWEPGTFVVAFDANGGKGEMAPQEFTYDTPQALSTNVFTRRGYDFYGWATNAAPGQGDVVFADTATVSNLTSVIGATTTLYAVWGAEQIVVTLNADASKKGYWGADQTCSLTNVTVIYGTEWNLPTPQSSDSTLTFQGWHWVDAEGYDYALPSQVPTSADGVTNLVAQWASSLSAALDAPELNFSVGSLGTPATWQAQSDVVNYGTSAAQGGFGIPSSSGEGCVTESYVWMSVCVPANSTLTFDWRLDSPCVDIYGGIMSGNKLYFVTNVTEAGVVNSGAAVFALTNLEERIVSGQWQQATWTNPSDEAYTVAWVFSQEGELGYDGTLFCGGTGWVDHVVLSTSTRPSDLRVRLPAGMDDVTVYWTSGAGTVRQEVIGSAFEVPYGATDVKVILVAADGFEFTTGGQEYVYALTSPLATNTLVDEADLPTVRAQSAVLQPSPIAFTCIAPTDFGFRLTFTNAVKHCVYKLYSALTPTGFDCSSAPDQTQTAEQDGAAYFDVDKSGLGASRFWKIVAEPGSIP